MNAKGGVARVLRAGEIPTVERGNGIRSIPLVDANAGSARLLTGMTIFPPRGEIALHTHSSEECVVLLEGKGAVDLNGERHELAVWDATFVSPGVPHRFVNLSDGPMRILWIYSDIDTTRTIVATGETTGHLGSYRPKV